MTPFDRRIVTEDDTVGEILTEVVDIAVAHGARLHPSLRIVESGGQMSVHAEADDDELLIEIPRALLIPIDDVEFEVVGDRLEATSFASLSAIQRRLLELQLALYNATGKMAWARQMLPSVALGGDSAEHRHDRELLQRLRPNALRDVDDPARAFLNTRVLATRVRSTTPASPPAPADGDGSDLVGSIEPHYQKSLMPLIDLVNHHRQGDRYRLSDSSLLLGARRVDDSTECFVNYAGRLDALGALLGFGFVAEGIGFTMLCPSEATVDGLQVIVAGRPGRLRDSLDPPHVAIEGSTLHLSHLSLHADHPERLSTMLAMAVTMAMRSMGLGDSADGLTRRIVVALTEADQAVVGEVERGLRVDGAMRLALSDALAAHRRVVDETLRSAG